MKPATAILSATLLIYLQACNPGTKTESAEKATKDTVEANKFDYKWIDDHCLAANGMANFIVKTSDAQDMIKGFDTGYRKYSTGERIEAMVDNFFVDSVTIRIMAQFLKNTRKHDGIRIHFGASPQSDVTSYPKPPYQNKTALYFFPTVFDSATKKHRDNWAYIDPAPSRSEFLKPYSLVSSSIATFEKVYQRRMPDNTTTGKSLSKSVWIDSCVIFFMYDLIDQNRNTVDGYNFKAAAYIGSADRWPEGAEDLKYASTILMVPTSPGQTGDRSNWTIMDELLKQKGAPFFDALNHGELCPKNCPPPAP